MSGISRNYSFPESQKPVEGIIGSVKEKAEEAASSVKDAAGAIQDKAGAFASSVAEGAESAWSSTKEGAATAWNSTKDGAQQLGSAVAHQAEVGAAELSIFVRRYPVASFLAALGVGLLAGQVLGASFRSGSSRH